MRSWSRSAKHLLVFQSCHSLIQAFNIHQFANCTVQLAIQACCSVVLVPLLFLQVLRYCPLLSFRYSPTPSWPFRYCHLSLSLVRDCSRPLPSFYHCPESVPLLSSSFVLAPSAVVFFHHCRSASAFFGFCFALLSSAIGVVPLLPCKRSAIVPFCRACSAIVLFRCFRSVGIGFPFLAMQPNSAPHIVWWLFTWLLEQARAFSALGLLFLVLVVTFVNADVTIVASHALSIKSFCF